MAASSKLSFVPPMEAKLVSELPSDEGWQFEPKWDGFRCVAVRDGAACEIWGKSGKPLSRFFPEVTAMFADLPQQRFIIDGELTVPINGIGSFEALQQRLHPAASRIVKLSTSTPALLVLFDLLHLEGQNWNERPLAERRAALEQFVDAAPKASTIRLSPATTKADDARHWYRNLTQDLDGVIAKRLDQAYIPGERAMLKIKQVRTADCVVGGFRYGTDTQLVGSLLLGLFNSDGKLDHVGFTSAISAAEKPALTEQLEALKDGPGFTGKAPGGPSRWSTERSAQWEPLRHELVAEVHYDQITASRFRHGTRFERWRPDKAPQACTMDQLAAPADPDAVIRAIVGTKVSEKKTTRPKRG